MRKLRALILGILSVPLLIGLASADFFYFNNSNAFREWTDSVP